MAQPFSFGFSGDDIDVDADVDQSSPAAAVPPAATPAQPEAALLPAHTHNVAELVGLYSYSPLCDFSSSLVLLSSIMGSIIFSISMLLFVSIPTFCVYACSFICAHDCTRLSLSILQLKTLPDKISYATQDIESPSGKKLSLPRRELFDVRVQLMAEDDGSDPDPLTGLDESDIRTNIYEGGFKTWECSVDLAKLLLDRGPRKDLDDLCRVDHVIEVSPPLPSYLPLLHTTNHFPAKKLGCGTAIPTLVLFHYALTQSLPLYFTLADYNASVLRLVTLPNLLLTWASTLPADSALFTPETPNPFASSESHGDLYLTPSLVTAFQATLAEAPLTLSLVSGSWVPVQSFVDLVPSAPHMNTLVLASETIYSPTALSAFADACVGLLRRVRMGKAIVAAKRVYFGVGGGVDAFKEEAAARGAVVADVENSGVEMGQGGVRRCLLEVQMM